MVALTGATLDAKELVSSATTYAGGAKSDLQGAFSQAPACQSLKSS